MQGLRDRCTAARSLDLSGAAYCPAVHGNFGEILQVELDLDGVVARRIELPQSVYRDYIGGVGLGAYLLWHHAPAGVDPLAPEAPLIYSFSPLLGSPLTTTAKFALLCKSPLTGRICDGLSSSRFALAAKRLGVDAVVIRGALARLSRLHLDEDPARCFVRPCPELAGLMPERRTVPPAAPLAVKAEVKADAVSR